MSNEQVVIMLLAKQSHQPARTHPRIWGQKATLYHLNSSARRNLGIIQQMRGSWAECNQSGRSEVQHHLGKGKTANKPVGPLARDKLVFEVNPSAS